MRLDQELDQDKELAAAAAAARWLDQRYLDPLIGFVLPGAGDLISASVGVYTLNLARRRGAPRVVLARMLLNLAVDTLFGSVPIAGDVWDVLFRAHARNLELLRDHSRAGVVSSSPHDWLVVLGAALAFAAALAVPVALFVWALGALLG